MMHADSICLRSASIYCRGSQPPPFERVSRKRMSEISRAAHYLLAVRTSYRLLLMESEYLLDLVEESQSSGMGLLTEHEGRVLDIRWCGMQIISLLLKVKDRASGNAEEAADLCSSSIFPIQDFLSLSTVLRTLILFLFPRGRTSDFCADVALEKGGLYVDLSGNTDNYVANDLSEQNCLKSFSVGPRYSRQLQEIEPCSEKLKAG